MHESDVEGDGPAGVEERLGSARERHTVNRVCVFCGSSAGETARYVDAASATGSLLARKGLTLVYGGSRVGLMGRLADSALDSGGDVVGVIPRALTRREVAHEGLTELHVVGSMHERKALMADLADGFLALPGGLGTLEEFFEVLTWSQLGLHRKPCGLLDVGGYFEALIRFLDHAVTQGFLAETHRRMILVHTEPEGLLRRLASYEPPELPRWIEAEET